MRPDQEPLMVPLIVVKEIVMLDIIKCIEKAMVVGNIKFQESNIRPNESIGFGPSHPTAVKVSVVEVDGKDVIVYTLPMVDATIYATDSLEEFKQTLLEKACLVVLGSNRSGFRNKLSFDYIRDRQNHDNVFSDDYGFVSYSERDELLKMAS